MEFFARTRKGRSDKPLLPPVLPAVCLLKDDWDDFSYKTSFQVFYFDASGNLREVGWTKILSTHGYTTQLPERFQSLPPEFCSLGSSLEFYESALELGLDTAKKILFAIRDVVVEPAHEQGLRETEGFSKSLLRFSEAEKAYKEAGVLFGRGQGTRGGVAFSFTCKLEGFSRPHVVPCDFQQTAQLPHRIICFVGKNGTGKSGVLAKLATTMSGWEQAPAGTFAPERPRFSRVVSLSYSIFQPFSAPFTNSTSYRYCGLRDEKGLVDVDALHERTLQSIAEIRTLGRAQDWLKLMKLRDLFGVQLPDLDAPGGMESLATLLKTLSSGQRIVVSLFSDLLQHIDRESLILFDEPEIYLHPTLLSTLMRMLHELLEQYDAYAIVATHSPIVVQEIPARSVRVFERQGNIPSQAPLPIESFGENLTEIVDRVFHMNEDDKNYKKLLRELVDKHSYDDIVAMFEDPLSLNARMYLLSLHRSG
jgi:predicted ATPase